MNNDYTFEIKGNIVNFVLNCNGEQTPIDKAEFMEHLRTSGIERELLEGFIRYCGVNAAWEENSEILGVYLKTK